MSNDFCDEPPVSIARSSSGRLRPGAVRASVWVALTLVLALVAGCSGGGGPTAGDGGFVGGDGNWTRVTPGQRKPAPDVAAEGLDGSRLSLADYRGKVVVLNVWGSWCTPCRKEAPDLVAAAAETEQTAQFIGLNTRDLDRAQAEAFVRSFKIDYPNIYDPRGELLLEFTDLPPSGIPSTLIIDKDGRVAARIIGVTTTITLVDIINDTAAGK